MSHCYYVRCRCGKVTDYFNKGEQDLIDAVKRSHACYLLSSVNSGWDLSSLEWRSGYRGLAAFLGEHFSHGGFEVCGEYSNDVPTPVIPVIPKTVLGEIYLAELRVEVDDLVQRVQDLKSMLEVS